MSKSGDNKRYMIVDKESGKTPSKANSISHKIKTSSQTDSKNIVQFICRNNF